MPELGVSNAQLILAAKQTAYMVFVSLAAGTVLAMIMAFALVLTRSDSILPNRFIYGILNTIINTVRSVPFIILMVFIMPLTKMVVGTRIGTTAALVPLVIFIAPYLTRLFENSLSRGLGDVYKRQDEYTAHVSNGSHPHYLCADHPNRGQPFCL